MAAKNQALVFILQTLLHNSEPIRKSHSIRNFNPNKSEPSFQHESNRINPFSGIPELDFQSEKVRMNPTLELFGLKIRFK